MTHVEKTLFESLIFKYVYYDTMIDVTVKKREQNKLEREFTCEEKSHCPYRRSFKSVHWARFVQSEDYKRIIPQRMMNYGKIPYKSTIHLYRGSNTISLLYCRRWTGNCTEGARTRTEGRQTIPRPWRVYNLSSVMGRVQFVSTTMPAKQN